MASISDLLRAHEARFPGAVSGGQPGQSAFGVFVDEFLKQKKEQEALQRQQQEQLRQEMLRKQRLQEARELAGGLGLEAEPTINKNYEVGVKFIKRNPLDTLQREVSEGKVSGRDRIIKRGVELGADPEKSVALADALRPVRNIFGEAGRTPGFVNPEARQPQGRMIPRQTIKEPEMTMADGSVSETQSLLEPEQSMLDQIKQIEESPDYEYIPEINEFGDVTGYKAKEVDKESKISAVKAEQQVKESAQSTLNTIDEIKKSIKYFGAASIIPALPGEYEKQNWQANVDKLQGRLVVNLMNDMKQASKTGATGFGQLSNRELGLLQGAATALRKGLAEEDALRYLKEIEDKAKKVLGKEVNNNDPLGIR